MSNPDKIQSKKSYETIYSPDVFIRLADEIVEHQKSNHLFVIDEPVQTVEWTVDDETAYSLKKIRADDTQLLAEKYTLQQFSINKPVRELVAEYAVDNSHGEIVSITKDMDQQMPSATKNARDAIEALSRRAVMVSPDETIKITKESNDKVFMRLVGTYTLSHLAFEDTDGPDTEQIGENAAYRAKKKYIDEMVAIKVDEYLASRKREYPNKEGLASSTDVLKATSASTPEDGFHDSTYMKDLLHDATLIDTVTTAAESLGGKWTTTVGDATDSYEAILRRNAGEL